MAALKFDTFTPDGVSETNREDDAATLIAQAFQDGHAKGFAQGCEESAREHADTQEQLRSQLIEVIKDHEQDHAQAQRGVITSLLPLVDNMVKTLAPNLAASGFMHELHEHLQAAIDSRPSAVPVITCAPELVSEIQAAFATWSGAFEVRGDNRMTPLEAQIRWDDGFDHIDLDRCLAELTQSIARFQQSLDINQDEELSNVG